MLELLITSAKIAFDFLKPTVPALLIGIFVAELLVENGVIGKFSLIGRPFVKFSNLPEECALAFTTAFLNTRAGNGMLVSFYKEGKISKKELYIASLMNAFPAMVRHWDSLIPVLLVTLGTLGLVYFGILVLIGFIQTIIFAIAGKLLIEPKRLKDAQEHVENSQEPFKKVLRKALVKTKNHSISILKTMLLATYITALLITAGFFEHLTSLMKDFAFLLPFSAAEISVMLSVMTSSIAAYTLGGNLLKAGLVSEKGLIKSLLLGSVFANVTYLRMLIPYYVGIFGSKDGIKIMLSSMTTRSIVILCLIPLVEVIL